MGSTPPLDADTLIDTADKDTEAQKSNVPRVPMAGNW